MSFDDISGYDVHAFDTLDSTNSELRRRMERTPLPEGYVVWALEQTQGRGRYERVWTSKKGGLYCSLLVYEQVPLTILSQLSFVAGVACGEALISLGTQGLSLKWPNDILINGAKVGGVLVESGTTLQNKRWAIIGLGVNVTSHPETPLYPATHLHRHGVHIRAENLLHDVLKSFQVWHLKWRREGFEPVRSYLVSHLWGVGQPTHVRQRDQESEGLLVGVDQEGALLLQTLEGEKRVYSGDVLFRGPGYDSSH